MDLKKIILSDPVNKWVFSNAGKDIFLVGGYVRDILRGVSSKDKDYAVKDNVEYLALEASKKFNGTFIALKKGMTYRVALKSKEILDFSSIEGSINEDLTRRDFTINAIAWSPKTGIIDISGGADDIRGKTIKAVQTKNLIDDPLRIIRAYRFSAELGFSIDTSTRGNLRKHSEGLKRVASERITDEAFKILKNKDAARYLIECHKDSVLKNILPVSAEELAQNLKLLKEFDLFYRTMPRILNKTLKEELSQGISRVGVIRLALLLRNSSIKDTRFRASEEIKKALTSIYKSSALASEISGQKEKLSKENLFRIFKTSGESVFETSAALSFLFGYEIGPLLKEAKRFIAVRHKTLLDGNEIQKLLNIPPSAKIGRILSSLQEEQFKGAVKTKAEAKKWVLNSSL
ncbi:MAG: CCA tRNA nucleotidyltransferase [Nitrospirae bacterium]|nr:CCA tRNA nucleotidyltransferase [Nitrospirota bacterium]